MLLQCQNTPSWFDWQSDGANCGNCRHAGVFNMDNRVLFMHSVGILCISGNHQKSCAAVGTQQISCNHQALLVLEFTCILRRCEDRHRQSMTNRISLIQAILPAKHAGKDQQMHQEKVCCRDGFEACWTSLSASGLLMRDGPFDKSCQT